MSNDALVKLYTKIKIDLITEYCKKIKDPKKIKEFVLETNSWIDPLISPAPATPEPEPTTPELVEIDIPQGDFEPKIMASPSTSFRDTMKKYGVTTKELANPFDFLTGIETADNARDYHRKFIRSWLNGTPELSVYMTPEDREKYIIDPSRGYLQVGHKEEIPLELSVHGRQFFDSLDKVNWNWVNSSENALTFFQENSLIWFVYAKSVNHAKRYIISEKFDHDEAHKWWWHAKKVARDRWIPIPDRAIHPRYSPQYIPHEWMFFSPTVEWMAHPLRATWRDWAGYDGFLRDVDYRNTKEIKTFPVKIHSLGWDWRTMDISQKSVRDNMVSHLKSIALMRVMVAEGVDIRKFRGKPSKSSEVNIQNNWIWGGNDRTYDYTPGFIQAVREIVASTPDCGGIFDYSQTPNLPPKFVDPDNLEAELNICSIIKGHHGFRKK